LVLFQPYFVFISHRRA